MFWHPEPGAEVVNAFSIKWSNLKCYVFPPFSLLPRVLRQISVDKALVVLIAPVWTTQSWYPLLNSSAARRQTDFTTAERQSLVPASQSNPPSHEGSSSSGRVEVIWQSLGDRGFSDEAARLITSSWTSGTDKQYNSAWKQWCSWCTQRKIDTL